MADPLRDQDTSAAVPPGRESRIEELLLAGLDHYFSGQHELAISVWTRVLFLDRSHARARAYIERARGAIAERQREGEELLQTGAAAFSRGDADDARRLLTSAVERGARPEEALAHAGAARAPRAGRRRRRRGAVRRASARYARRLGARSPAARAAGGIRAATLLLVLAIGLAAGVLVMIARSLRRAGRGAAAVPGRAATPSRRRRRIRCRCRRPPKCRSRARAPGRAADACATRSPRSTPSAPAIRCARRPTSCARTIQQQLLDCGATRTAAPPPSP